MLMLSAEQVPDGWTRTTLREQLALCRNGLVCRQDYDPSKGVAVTRIETISDGEINWTRVGHTSPDEVNPSYLLKRGDILLSHINSVKHIGKVARKTDDRALIHGMNLMSLRCAETLDPGFGFAVMSSKRTKTYMERRAKKAVNQASVNRQDIFDLRILLPPLHEQRAIAGVLDAIDEAKERTEAVIAATERLRDSLLHELLTRGVPGWHKEWKEVAGVGTVPACWEVVRLGEVYEVQLGKMLSPKSKQGANPRPYLTNRNVRWGGFDLSDVPVMDFDQREIEKFRLRRGDLLVCEGGDTGRAAIWRGEIGDCYYQKALHRLRPITEHNASEFMLAVLMLYASKGVLLEHSEKTSISHLTRERLLRIRVPNPTRCEQEEIVAALRRVGESIKRGCDERDKMKALKVSAADALLTGRVRGIKEEMATYRVDSCANETHGTDIAEN